MWHDRLYLTTPDAQLVCLDAHRRKTNLANPDRRSRTESLRQRRAARSSRSHYCRHVRRHRADLPGFLESVDPMTGKVEWRWDAMPKPDDTVAWNSWPHDTDVVTRGGGMTWITGTYDPRAQSSLLGHRQSASGGKWRHAHRRQSLHLHDRCAQSRHRKTRLVFPVVAARHARLGHGDDAGAFRRDVQGQAAQDARAGQQERAVLRPRSHQRKSADLRSVCPRELAQGLSTSTASRFRIPTKSRSPTACSSPAASARTGRRPATIRKPDSSM